MARRSESRKTPRFDKTVNDTWSRIGCDVEGSPYVMSNLTGRLSNLTDKGRAVVVHFQDKKCEGRKGLPANKLASLKKISTLTDLGWIRGTHAEAQAAAPPAFSALVLPLAGEKTSPAPAPVFGDLSARGEREVATPITPDPWPRPAHHPQHIVHAAPNGNMLTLTGDTTALLNQQELARHRSVASTPDNSISSFFRSLFH